MIEDHSSGSSLASGPDAAVVNERTWKVRIISGLPWLIVSLPALYQLLLLATAIAGRIGYPYDLEWMEGGILHHALRIRHGEGIYVAPSVEFIPYLYTPLYPSLLAMLSGAFGISYTVGRVVSVLSLIGMAVVAVVHLGNKRHAHQANGPALVGAVFAMGLFAAAYPYMEGWYDLVRADSLYLYIVTAALAALPRWAAAGHGAGGHARVAAGALMLVLAFFCKQTAIMYVAWGGLVVLVVAWRRVFTYGLVAGVLGVGGTYLLQRTSGGWFWVYTREIHQAHDFNIDRFFSSFGYILWHIPAMTVVVGLTVVFVLTTRILKGKLARGTQPFLLWAPTYAVSTVLGAIGWGTEFAHFNAYMPAFLHGGLAAGAALPAVYACARMWRDDGRIATVAALLAALPLAWACATMTWNPQKFIPTPADRAAGDRLIGRIHAIEGEVWMPSHPWYLELAGKQPRVHRMGIKDVTTRQTRTVEGLDRALKHHAFAAIFLDDRDVQLPGELPALAQNYRPVVQLGADERPHVYSGARVTPDTVWVPIVAATPPPKAKVVFDFEQPTWTGWTTSGAAWGPQPVTEGHPAQGVVQGVTGLRFANSMSGGDASTGRLTSPLFTLDGPLTAHIGGTSDGSRIRVELWVENKIVAMAVVPSPGGDALRTVTLDPGARRGAQGRLVFVDDSPSGHLEVDDVWMWQLKASPVGDPGDAGDDKR